MGHWGTCLPRLPTIHFVLLQFGAIQSMTAVSYVIYLPGLRATVIEISSFFILSKK